MLRVSNIKLLYTHSEAELIEKIGRQLNLRKDNSFEYKIVKKSIDAREKPKIYYVYTVDVTVDDEKKVLKKSCGSAVSLAPCDEYAFPASGIERLRHRPVIVGCGPAGLFAGYMLAKAGYSPLLLERGGEVLEREQKVAHFWETGELDCNTNVSFGEGGAGTFSDGKLRTLVKDKNFRNSKVVDIFVKFGAPEEIKYLQNPHIGTDKLRKVIFNMRKAIEELGGEVRFHTTLTDIDEKDGWLKGIYVNSKQYIECEALVIACGHSARDTFEMLGKKIFIEPKPFAIGLRIEHPQEMINHSQYGNADSSMLGAASYKLTYQASNGRGVYSFCMCPGGYVVNASSEPGKLAINGMSNHARDGRNANSALIVTVTPDDFPDRTYMGGVRLQRRLEEAAFAQCSGKIPVQLYSDFANNRISTGFGDVLPDTKGECDFGVLNDILPKSLCESIIEAMPVFDRKIKGFGREDAVLLGVESRTSSPLRMLRDKGCESSIKGVYPCGEGAGYAGGITSAAMDGIKIAESIAARYRKPDRDSR